MAYMWYFLFYSETEPGYPALHIALERVKKEK